MAGADKGLPDEDSTADYWVVESDRVTRIHITPRYWLFAPSADSFPVPLDYIDVLRFTKTNVKGHDTLVDCWVSGSDQAPGPWIGKTSFNLRLPIPKPGWVMQNGRPTRIEANSKRPENIWCGVWELLTRKQREEEKRKWDLLKPIVEECRQERNLPPVQKHDNVFWETLKKAKELHKAPSAPAMPLIEQCESEDLSLQVRHFGPYQDVVELLEARIKELEATLPEKGSVAAQRPRSASISSSSGSHTDRIAAK